MGATSWPPHVRYGQQSPNEAYHPIIGVCDVMKEVEADISVHPPGNEIRLDLPEVIIELVATLKF